MQVTNKSLSPLIFADGRLLAAGETKDLPDLDQKHGVHAAWLEAGMIEYGEDEKKTTTKK